MLTKLSRETLAEQAARNLIAFIEAQDLKPGKMLPPESKLAADLGVSRPIIREALKSLEGRGIIEVVGGKGAVVKPLDNQALRLYFQRAMQIDREAVIDLFELRESIEVRSAALAAGQRTPEEVTQLAGIVAEMRNHLRDPETYVELDIQFHQLIASMTHNAMIYHLIGAIREAIKDMLHESLLRPITEAQLEHVQVGHEAILSALEQGDAQAAEITMTAHFNDAVTSLIYGAIGSIVARAQVKAK
ncbi:MAG TPA: FadR/GntR family transcriptional regulator [Roseiflexaceae bacterium]|nr:FadR/GntR family transcriptional regulator [Roseiflexaceae bacterium]